MVVYTGGVSGIPVRSNNNVVWQCAYHLVWCTKYRRPILGGNNETRLKEIITDRLLRAEFPSFKSRLPTLWTNPYFVATTGGVPFERIKQYVESQKGV